MKHLWARSVKFDKGVPWSTYGFRADFVFTLFMAGHSIKAIATGLVDGQHFPAEAVEDCIRCGIYLAKKGARTT